jgi:hypothetical protein
MLCLHWSIRRYAAGSTEKWILLTSLKIMLSKVAIFICTSDHRIESHMVLGQHGSGVSLSAMGNVSLKTDMRCAAGIILAKWMTHKIGCLF